MSEHHTPLPANLAQRIQDGTAFEYGIFDSPSRPRTYEELEAVVRRDIADAGHEVLLMKHVSAPWGERAVYAIAGPEAGE